VLMLGLPDFSAGHPARFDDADLQLLPGGLAEPNEHGGGIVTSGVNFTQNQRFEFPYDVVSASSPEPVKAATVLGPIKMLWGSSGETYLSLH
jgi:hypothetical protein